MDIIQLEQPLPEKWSKATSNKNGQSYYINSEKKLSQWDFPREEYVDNDKETLASTLSVMEYNDITARVQLRHWLKKTVCKEICIAFSSYCFGSDKTFSVVDMGCGNGDITKVLVKYSSDIHGWDTLPANIDIPGIQMKQFDFCCSGESLPEKTPIGKCGLVFCIDSAQYAFSDVTSARRWSRKLKILLRHDGVAVILIPDATSIIESTGNGCIEYILSGRQYIESDGQAWPSTWERPVYGARYCVSKAVHQSGIRRPTTRQCSDISWVVTSKTMHHALDYAGLMIDAQFRANDFLSWCGIGDSQIHDSNNKTSTLEYNKRRKRTEDGILQQKLHLFSGVSWSEIEKWTIYIVSKGGNESKSKSMFT